MTNEIAIAKNEAITFQEKVIVLEKVVADIEVIDTDGLNYGTGLLKEIKDRINGIETKRKESEIMARRK